MIFPRSRGDEGVIKIGNGILDVTTNVVHDFLSNLWHHLLLRPIPRATGIAAKTKRSGEVGEMARVFFDFKGAELHGDVKFG